MFRNRKFTQHLEKGQEHVHTKTLQTFVKNKFIIEGINNKQTHSPIATSL